MSRSIRHFKAADFGADDATLADARAHEGDRAPLLLRAARRQVALGHPEDAIPLYERVLAIPCDDELAREAAEWEAVRWRNRLPGATRDPRGPLHFAEHHPGSTWSAWALLASALAGVPVAELEPAFAKLAAVTNEPTRLRNVTLAALAAQSYDAALTAAQRLFKMLPHNPVVLDTLAEVYYYRHEPAMAVHFSTLAVAGAPREASFRADLDRFQAADGRPSRSVATARSEGLTMVRELFGVEANGPQWRF